MKTVPYFFQIDGLRAIAVLSVILFHINSSWIPGGFIGVDIFFVISGFLITRIILSEIQNETFTFSYFYQRRIRRILPALYTVLFVTLVVGYVLLLPQDINTLIKSSLKTLLFLANYYFSSYYDYFGPSSHELPLLHMWSLAVEEQFYFIMPSVMYVLNKVMPTRIGIIILVGVLASFSLAQVFISLNYKTTWAYYSLPTRSGQLLSGAYLAYQYLNNSSILKKESLINLSGMMGFSILIGCFTFLTETTPYPGVFSIFPTLGAYLVLLGIVSSKSWGMNFLQTRVIREIGNLSYSLYLWHWPILAYMRYVYGEKDLPINWIMLAVVLTFSLSYFSWKFVETPFRRVRWNFKKVFLLLFVLPLVLIYLMMCASKYMGLTKNNLPPELTSYGGPELCHGVIHKSCTRGDLSKKPKALLIGDSHAAHLNYFFDELGKKQEFSIDVVTASSCSPIFGYDENVLPEAARKPCRIIKKYIEENYKNYDQIFIASNWTYHLGLNGNEGVDLSYMKKLENMILKLKKEEKDVTLVSQVPLLKKHILRAFNFKKLGLHPHITVKDIYKEANNRIHDLLKNKHVGWLNISDTVGNNIFLKEKPIYMDEQHLNKIGAKALGWMFFKKF